MLLLQKDGENNQESQVSSLSNSYRKAMPYLNLVYVFIASIVMFGFLGWYVDDYFQAKPLFMVLGIFIGLGIGFHSLLKSLKQLEEKNT